MSLYIGNKKVTPIKIAEGSKINNQDKTITENGTYTADVGYTGLGTVEVNIPEKTFITQEKTVTDNGVVIPDSGFDGLSKVTINIPSYPEPTGTISITNNGLVNVKDYENADVSIASITPTGTKTITSNGTYDVTNYASAEVNISGGDSIGITRETSSTGVYQVPTMNFTFSLPPNATDVGNSALYYAFYDCTSLTSVNLSSLTNISGNNAFYNAFYDCTSLTSVDFSNLTSISGNSALCSAFTGCTSLTSVDFSNLTSISGNSALYYAFYDCTSLTSVDLSSLTNISGYNALYNAFYDCTSLTSVDLSSLTQIGSSTTSTINNSHFRYCFYNTKITELAFPKLEYIYCTGSGSSSNGTFAYNTTLKKLYFPKLKDITYSPAYTGTSTSYTGARNYVFSNCSNLTEIHFGAENQASIEATSGYATLWGRGAGNATVYFDL